MHILLVEAVTPRATEAARALTGAGHTVHTCHAANDTDATCLAVHGKPCPLETAPIDAVVTVRPVVSRPTPLEDGVLCGVRRKVPVVVGGSLAHDPWHHWEAVSWPGTDLADAVESALRRPLPEHSEIATIALRTSLDPANAWQSRANAFVHRRDGGIRVTVQPDGPIAKETFQRASVRICQALRAHDPWASTIDVSQAPPSYGKR